MTTYYVAANGSDSNTGIDPSTPWATTAQVNTALTGNTIKRGDAILYRAGDIFYGSIASIPKASGLTSGPRLVIGSYGSGPPPIISGYKAANNTSGWIQHSVGVWKIDLTNAVNFTGNTSNLSANTGFLKINGTIKGAKKWQLSDLVNPWDFYNDTTYLYVAASANPTTLAGDIKIAVYGTLIIGQSGLVVAGLELIGSGSHGYRQSNTEAVGYIEIVGNKIHECGGAQLGSTGTTRYGNGVELWIGSYDAIIHYNEIYDIYDVAFTIQGAQSGSAIGWNSCHARFNTIWNCCQAFEQWSKGTNTSSGAGFVNCSFTDNVCINMGRSWSYSVRPDQQGKGTGILIYSQELPVDIAVRRNVFFDPRDNYCFINTNANTIKAGFSSDDNVIALRSGTRVQSQTAQTIENYTEWVNATGLDKRSVWVTVPSSVLTVQDAFGFLASYAALAGHRHKVSERAYGEARAATAMKVEEAVNSITTKLPVQIVVTQRTTGSIDYAPLLSVTLTNDYSRYDGVFFYTTEDDSTNDRRENGIFTVRFVGPASGSAPYVRLDLAELTPFKAGDPNRLQRSDFIAVLETSDKSTQTYKISIWLRRVDNYTTVRFKEQNSVVSGLGSFIYSSNGLASAMLPTGTQTVPTLDPAWIPRPTTGTGVPIAAPLFIGQKYVDTTAKKTYSAVGTSSSGDWESIPVSSGLPFGFPCPLVSGLYYSAAATSISAGTPGGVNGFMTGYRLIVGRSCIVANLAIDVTVAGSVGSVVRLMVYGLALANPPVGTLLVDAGTVDATTIGVKTLAISLNVNVGDQLYVAAAIQGATGALPVIRTSDGLDPAIGSTAAVLTNTRLLGLQAPGITGAAPSSINLSVSGSPARVMISAA